MPGLPLRLLRGEEDRSRPRWPRLRYHSLSEVWLRFLTPKGNRRMSRLGRRNKTRWIKLMKRRGYKWFGGKLWQQFKWTLQVPQWQESAFSFTSEYE